MKEQRELSSSGARSSSRIEPMQQSGFFSRYDQCRLCWIAFYTGAAIFANKDGVVTKQTGTKTSD